MLVAAQPQSQTMDTATLRQQLPPFSHFETGHYALYQHYLAHYGLGDLAQTQTIGTFSSGVYSVVGQAFTAPQPRGNALVIHGFTDHTGLYGPLLRQLLAAQMNVICIDLPGHGLSSGPRPASTAFLTISPRLTRHLPPQKTIYRRYPGICWAKAWAEP